MRRLSAGLLLYWVGTQEPFLDPLAEGPEHYRLELENEYLRVLREKVPSGTEVAMHSHRARVSIYLRDSDVVLTSSDGTIVEASQRAGTAAWGPAVTHEARVIRAVENLSVELKELAGEPVPVPERDATRVDPEHHVVELENDLLRVVRMTYPPGWTTPLHTHLPGVYVPLGDFRFRNVLENGESELTEGTAGSLRWSDGVPPHRTENQGSGDAVVLRVELKRKPLSPRD
jgi:hypothetical protein